MTICEDESTHEATVAQTPVSSDTIVTVNRNGNEDIEDDITLSTVLGNADSVSLATGAGLLNPGLT